MAPKQFPYVPPELLARLEEREGLRSGGLQEPPPPLATSHFISLQNCETRRSYRWPARYPPAGPRVS